MKLNDLWIEVDKAYEAFLNTHSNTDTIHLICIYSLYKLSNGKRTIDTSKIPFQTHKAKINFKANFDTSVKICKIYYKLLKKHKSFENRTNLYPFDIYKYIVDCIILEFKDRVGVQNYSSLQNCKIELHGLVNNTIDYSIGTLSQAKYLYAQVCKKLYNTVTAKELSENILFKCQILASEYLQ